MKYSLAIICLFLSFLGISQEINPLDAKSFNAEMALLGKKMNAGFL
jgi:hypothetical protein